MLFVIQFRDHPDKLYLRSELMGAHLDYLEAKETVIRTAGSLRRESDDGAIGGLWIVDVPDYEAARHLYLDDPFWKIGLRASVEIHRLAKAFPEIEKSI